MKHGAGRWVCITCGSLGLRREPLDHCRTVELTCHRNESGAFHDIERRALCMQPLSHLEMTSGTRNVDGQCAIAVRLVEGHALCVQPLSHLEMTASTRII